MHGGFVEDGLCRDDTDGKSVAVHLRCSWSTVVKTDLRTVLAPSAGSAASSCWMTPEGVVAEVEAVQGRTHGRAGGACRRDTSPAARCWRRLSGHRTRRPQISCKVLTHMGAWSGVHDGCWWPVRSSTRTLSLSTVRASLDT